MNIQDINLERQFTCQNVHCSAKISPDSLIECVKCNFAKKKWGKQMDMIADTDGTYFDQPGWYINTKLNVCFCQGEYLRLFF